MPFFRMRLILALIVGTTLVSVGSTYLTCSPISSHCARVDSPNGVARYNPAARNGAGRSFRKC